MTLKSVSINFLGMVLGLCSVSAMAAEPDSSLWTGSDTIPSLHQIQTIPNVEYIQVKERQPKKDGWKWHHGASIIRYKGDFYVSVGVNRGLENTIGEKILMLKSSGDWRHWEEPVVLEPQDNTYGRSHGVFLEHEGKLWSFHAKFVARGKGKGITFPGLTMEAFQLNESTGKWENRGDVAQGIWPLHEPRILPNGDIAVAGCDENWRGSVAIAHSNNLLHWDTIKVNVRGKVYTEGNLLQEGNDLLLLLRNESGDKTKTLFAAISRSRDNGRTWSKPKESNMPMNMSKPAFGVLSNGVRFLVGLTASNNQSRAALTIAYGRPGETGICHIKKIRDIADPVPPGAFKADCFSYPHAVQYEDRLFVIYSAGDVQAGGNNNHIEMAVIPVAELTVP